MKAPYTIPLLALSFTAVLMSLASEMQEQKSAALNIIDQPIPYGDLRRQLTLDYIRHHCDPKASSIDITPRMVVVHWTSSASTKSAFATFAPEKLPLWRIDLRRGGLVNVSAHFVVGRDGRIYRLMPETWMARHVIGLNHVSIGVENVGGPWDPLTPEQLISDTALIRELVARYPTIRYLIGHHEYVRFRDTQLWCERDNSYLTRKQDPGEDFMRRLREALQDLGLRAAWSDSTGQALK
jgi:N-acetyl-anhydromuramyl-L-alanine amidase AmpD